MLWYKSLQTLQHNWLYMQYETLLQKGQAKFNTDYYSYTYDNKKSD